MDFKLQVWAAFSRYSLLFAILALSTFPFAFVTSSAVAEYVRNGYCFHVQLRPKHAKPLGAERSALVPRVTVELMDEGRYWVSGVPCGVNDLLPTINAQLEALPSDQRLVYVRASGRSRVASVYDLLAMVRASSAGAVVLDTVRECE